MLKKIIILLIVISAAVSCVLVLQTPYAHAESADERYKLEIMYTDFLTADGEIQRGVRFKINAALFDEAPDTGAVYDAVAALYESDNRFSVVNAGGYLEILLESYGDYTEMYVAYGYTGYDKDDSDNKSEKGFLFEKITVERQTVFANVSYMSLFNEIGSEIMLRLMFFGIENDDVGYFYCYGTKYGTHYLNSNADSKYSYNGMTIHEFKMNDAERQIEFYYTIPNTSAWYGVTIAAVAVAAGVVLFLVIRKKKLKG